MSEYKGIRGWKVQTVSTDPASSGMASATWSSGGALNTGRHNFLGRAGTQTAALVATGTEAPASATVNTELYDGSSWTEVNNVNQARQDGGGAGATNTAALIFGGYFPGPNTRYGNTETWNGTSWTEVNDLNTARNSVGGAGTQTSALYFGGFDPSVPGFTGKTESWNGTSWTEVSDLNTARNSFGTFGYSNTAIIAASGSPTPSAVESWNGSSWTEIAELNTSRTSAGGSGESTDGLIFGGYTTTEVGNTESWNGSAWTELNDLANARRNGAGALGGTSSTALYAGGVQPSPAYSTVTEEWNTPSVFQQLNLGQVYYNSTSNAFKVTQQPVPGGIWASGGNLNTARSRFGGASQATQNAGLVFGAGSSPFGQTEEYNGTAWSEQNDLNTGRYISYGGAGSQTACVTAGGYNPAGSPVFNTVFSETYNGTSWTEGNDLNTGRLDCSTFGSSTDGVLVGGGISPGGPGTVTNVETYNGTSWTETTDIPTATQEMGSLGTGTAGLIFGGSVDNDPTTKNTTVEWNGTSWTSGGNYPIYVKYTTGFGSLTNGIGAGGNDQVGSNTGVCNVYDGTSWSEIAELTTVRNGLSGNGTASAGLVGGGYTTVEVTTTEEWTVPISNSTITVS